MSNKGTLKLGRTIPAWRKQVGLGITHMNARIRLVEQYSFVGGARRPEPVGLPKRRRV